MLFIQNRIPSYTILLCPSLLIRNQFIFNDEAYLLFPVSIWYHLWLPTVTIKYKLVIIVNSLMYINIETQCTKIETHQKLLHSHGMTSDVHLNQNLQLCVLQMYFDLVECYNKINQIG